jgi:multidrug transporter EmrE-like cation transporter
VNTYASIFYCFLYGLLNVSGATLVKHELTTNPLTSLKDLLPFLLKVKVIAAFFIAFVSALVLFKALSINRFTLVFPVANGINFAFSILVGYFFFKDRLSFLHGVGLLLLFSGILILGIAGRK